MFELYFFIGAILLLNIYVNVMIIKDDTFFLDEEKPSYIRNIWLIPIIGAGLGLYRLHANRIFYIGVTVVYFVLKIGLYYLMFGII